jgi:transposase-like protein
MVSTYNKVDTYMKERAAPRIEGLITGRKSDGRCVYSKAGKVALVQACLQPGVSVAASALANGVNANLLRKWILRYQSKQRGKAGALTKSAAATPAVLLPVISEAAQTAPATIRVEPVQPKAQSPGSIEIEYAGARIVLCGAVSAQQLGVVLACLSRSS